MIKKLRAGFTLIEVLVATAIFAVVIVSIYSAFQTGLLSYRKVDSSFAVYQTARSIFTRLQLDLRNSYVFAEGDSRFKGKESGLDLFSVIRAFDKTGESRPDISRIRYETDGTRLTRSCASGLNAFKDESAAETGELSLLVKKISFKYAYPAKEGGKPYGWQGDWPKKDDENQKKSLPLAVKVELAVIAKDDTSPSVKSQERAVTFTRVISLAPRISKDE